MIRITVSARRPRDLGAALCVSAEDPCAGAESGSGSSLEPQNLHRTASALRALAGIRSLYIFRVSDIV